MPPRIQARSPHNDPGALLGDELRELRKAAGYRSQDEVAQIIGNDRSVLGKAETGDQPPTKEVLTKLLDTYRVTGRLRVVYERLAILARAREDPVKYQTIPWFETEAIAHTLRYWAPTIFPGFVQTPAYARALSTAMGYHQAKVNEDVKARMARRAILERPSTPDVSIVVWEPVLHHPIAAPDDMREQLAFLVELSHRPTVTIQIVPTKMGANIGLGGAINLAATDDAPEALLSEGLVEDVVTTDPVRVRRASSIFNSVRADAMNRSDSRGTLSKAVEKWNQTTSGASPASAAPVGRPVAWRSAPGGDPRGGLTQG
jgi:transcriptional regulator with XRE-family HTH domain